MAHSVCRCVDFETRDIRTLLQECTFRCLCVLPVSYCPQMVLYCSYCNRFFVVLVWFSWCIATRTHRSHLSCAYPHLFNAVTALGMGRHYPVFFLKTYTLFAQCISCVSVYEFEPLTLGLVLNLSVLLSIKHQRRSKRQREENLSMEHYVNHDSLTNNILRRMHPFFLAPSRRYGWEHVTLCLRSVKRAPACPSQSPELWCGCEPLQRWGYQKMVKFLGVKRRR